MKVGRRVKTNLLDWAPVDMEMSASAVVAFHGRRPVLTPTASYVRRSRQTSHNFLTAGGQTATLHPYMLNLTNLRSLLAQAVSPGDIHTAALFTPEGQLISFAADPSRPKDEIRILVGMGGETWQETREQGLGMVESEVRVSVCFGLVVDG